MEKKDYELIVSQGKRPFWQRMVASVFFASLLYFLLEAAILFYNYGFNMKTFSIMPKFIEVVTFSLSGGVFFSITKTVLIDTDKDQLVSRFCIGPFSRDVPSTVPELDYVSVFLDAKGFYQVNLWYKANKHYKMYAFDEKKPAMDFAAMAASRLEIDLLDATEKGNSKWIEKETA